MVAARLGVFVYTISFFVLPVIANGQASIVPVHEEAHHKVVYQDKSVRVLEVSAEAGESCDYHLHQNNMAYVVLRGTTIRLDTAGGKHLKTVDLPRGYVGKEATHRRIPMAHRFTNEGERDFLVYAVEILNNKDEFGIRKIELKHSTSNVDLKPGDILFYDPEQIWVDQRNRKGSPGWMFAENRVTVNILKRASRDPSVYVFSMRNLIEIPHDPH